MTSRFGLSRRKYHERLASTVLRIEDGVLSIADKGNAASAAIAKGIADRLGIGNAEAKLSGQKAGNESEIATAEFVRDTFLVGAHEE